MQTLKWGPGLWTALHCMTFNYPSKGSEIDKQTYKNFFTSLKLMLTCKYCRESYTIYLKYFPIDNFLEDREGITYWLFRLHNLVNQKLMKPQIDFIDCAITYEKMRAKCGKVIEDDEKYKECVKKSELINVNDVKQFVVNAINKYESTANNFIVKLLSSPDNPGKECNVCKVKVYYDRY